MQVSLRSIETVIQTPIRNRTLRVLERVNLIDLRLGVGIVEIIRKETNKTQTTTNKIVNPSTNGNENLLLSKSIPRGIRIR